MEVDNPSTVSKASKGSSKVSKASSKKVVRGNAVSEDDLSMSDLFLLANQNKVKKDKLEVDVEDIISKKDDSERIEIQSIRSVPEKKTKTRSRRDSTTESVDSSRANREKLRKVNKENKDDVIRREKSTYLYKINLLNQKRSISNWVRKN